MTTKTIRWVLAHEPLDIFLRAAEKFAAKVAEVTNNELNVEILSLGEYADKYNNGTPVNYLELVDYLNQGKLEMSQMYTHHLGRYAKDMRALDMPFLFKDHDHAARVLDGKIGKNILSGLSSNEDTKNVKGLAFTYSGGYTVLSANKEIKSVSDLVGLKMRVPYSPVVQDYIQDLGVTTVKLELNELYEALKNKEIDGAEITYRRLYEVNGQEYSSSVLHSNHNLFLTSIIINKDFWNSLDSNLQEVITQAALLAAQEERQEAVDDDVTYRAKCLTDGITVNDLNPTVEEELKEKSKHVYSKWTGYFSLGLLDKIKMA